MKEFITGVETGKQESGASVREQVTRPEIHSDPNVIKELAEKVAQSGQERLEVLQPETPEQEKKKGFLSGIGEKIKGIIKGKELSPQDQLQQDIHALTHFTSSNAGLGGLGNFSSGGFGGLSAIAERYNIAPETITSITTLQKQVESLDNGPEKVEAMKNLRDQKIAVMQDMRKSVEGK